MKFSYNWIKEYVDVRESAEKVADNLTMHSFEVENVVRDGADYVFQIDILPNRIADASSHIGIARELAALYKKGLKFPQPALKEDKNLKIKDWAEVNVAGKNICPRYSARVITDVRVGPSPARLQKKLRAVGLKPINNVVDAANYVMLELGQPLHVFDLDKVSEHSIIVRRAKGGEQIETLDGEKYKLGADDIVIADPKKILAIAGIKGGSSSGINKKTKTILLESANFDRISVRRTSKSLRLQTDASVRFGAGISPSLTTGALDRLAEVVIQLSGGRLVSGVIDVKEKLPPRRAVVFSLDDLGQFLGTSVSLKEVLRILKALGFKAKEKGKDRDKKISVVVPEIRVDVERKEDVYEEIGRILGYKNIKSVPFSGEIRPIGLNEERDFRFKVKDALSHLGFYEVINYIFLSKEELRVEDINGQKVWELLNPISSDKKFLRQTLLSGILKNVRDNQRFYESSAFFEVGKVYNKRHGAPEENWDIILVFAEKKPVDASQTFYALKGRTETFLEKMGILGIGAIEAVGKNLPFCFNPASSARLTSEGNKVIGFLGELHPKIADFYNIKGSVVVALFKMSRLAELSSADKFFKEIPKFPPLKRDIAIIVSTDVRMVEIENVIYNATPGYLIDVDLFDIYEDSGGGEQKSMAFHLIFRSDKKTLTKKDVEAEEKKIKKALEEELDAQVR